RQQYLLHGLAAGRFVFIAVISEVASNADAPDAVDVVSQGISVVRRVADGKEHHAEQHEVRDEDLETDEQVVALAIPQQPNDVPDHWLPPLSASTGWRRDMRHAG